MNLLVGIKHKGEMIKLAEFDLEQDDTAKDILHFMRAVAKEHEVYIASDTMMEWSKDGE